MIVLRKMWFIMTSFATTSRSCSKDPPLREHRHCPWEREL